MTFILGFCVGVIIVVGYYVVPGVEFEYVVYGFEIAGAEFEGVGAFEIVDWVVRAVGWGCGFFVDFWRVRRSVCSF